MGKESAMKWQAGDLFFHPQSPTRINRVHRVKGSAVWYLPNQYGHNPPRGVLRCDKGEQKAWVKVERDFARPRNATTYEFTAMGQRSIRRDACEKCNTETNWIVMVNGRAAYWCGCGD